MLIFSLHIRIKGKHDHDGTSKKQKLALWELSELSMGSEEVLFQALQYLSAFISMKQSKLGSWLRLPLVVCTQQNRFKIELSQKMLKCNLNSGVASAWAHIVVPH